MKVNRKKNQYSLRLALPVNVAYLLKHVEIALTIDFSSVGFKKCMPTLEISRENSDKLRSLLLLDLRSIGLNGQNNLLRGGLLTREHDPNRAACKSAPDKTLGPPEPRCLSAKDQRTKCPAKSQAKHADPNNLTSTHY